MKTIYLVPVIIYLCSLAHAEDSSMKVSCETTPVIWQLTNWPVIAKSNNLRRAAGSVSIAQGKQIFIEGKITDSDCVPVVGASVEIWQADYSGKMAGFIKSERKGDPVFKYTGMAITDNFGDYSFITIFPGALPSRAPFVKFRIKRQNFMPMETVMFFENQPANSSDPVFKHEVDINKRHLLIAKVEKIYKNDQEEGIKYQFDITLEGKNKYLKY